MPKQNPYKNPNIGGSEPSRPNTAPPTVPRPTVSSTPTSTSSYTPSRSISSWYGVIPTIVVAIAILTTLILLAPMPAWIFIIVNAVEIVALGLLMIFTAFGDYGEEYPIANIVILNILSIIVIIALCSHWAGEFQETYRGSVDWDYLKKAKFVMGFGGVILIAGTIFASVIGMQTVGSIIAPLSGVGGTCVYIALYNACITSSSDFILSIRGFWAEIGLPGIHTFLASVILLIVCLLYMAATTIGATFLNDY